MLSRRYNPLVLLPSGRGAARLAHLHGVQGVPGSNPGAPTDGASRESGKLGFH